jgi:hypothetical protein
MLELPFGQHKQSEFKGGLDSGTMRLINGIQINPTWPPLLVSLQGLMLASRHRQIFVLAHDYKEEEK